MKEILHFNGGVLVVVVLCILNGRQIDPYQLIMAILFGGIAAVFLL